MYSCSYRRLPGDKSGPKEKMTIRQIDVRVAVLLVTVKCVCGVVLQIKWLACFSANLGSVVMFLTILSYFYLHGDDDGSFTQPLF
ncbi:unnamed protein product [Toxocara canis]|uniref:Aa_trans domain-containing protein n=1 Tax=Toxocara canis TaxID=6265 RepID=A0A183USD3_TOXCA|nr:unnamed protein product [Toxocara canis]